MNAVLGIVHNNDGDVKLKNTQQALSSLLKTTQIGQTGIRSVLDISMRPGLRKALEAQLREFDHIESDVCSVASQRGWELKELDPALRFFSDKTMRLRLNGRNTDSQIANLMILRNTKDMIKNIQTIQQFDGKDTQLQMLAQKLLDCEKAHIKQMQLFL